MYVERRNTSQWFKQSRRAKVQNGKMDDLLTSQTGHPVRK